MVTQAKFGTVTFPINPQTMSRTYLRALAVKNRLGTTQLLESRQRGLARVDLEGILAGTNAKQTMYDLETLFEAETPALLITPFKPGGENALMVEQQFTAEQRKFYERTIPFRLGFILTDAVIKPDWKVYVHDGGDPGTFNEITDLLDVSVEKTFGSTAASFSFSADNSTGQNKYPNLDYQRMVKIEFGFEEYPAHVPQEGPFQDTPLLKRKMWGLIDTLDYSITKGSGSIVKVGGRNYAAKLLEGYTDDWSFYDELWFNILGGETVADSLFEGVDMEVDADEPDWRNWAGSSFRHSMILRNSTRLEGIQKLSDIYSMYVNIDDGEYQDVPNRPPVFHWENIQRISPFIEDAPQGQTWIKVEYAEQFRYLKGIGAPNQLRLKVGFDPSKPPGQKSCDMAVDVLEVYPDTNRIDISTGLWYNYPLSRGPIAFVGEDVKAWQKTWGQDIISFSARFTGIPIRTRIEVYGNGVWAIADASETHILPTAPTLRENPGYNPDIADKYGTPARKHIIEDNSLISFESCAVIAYTELLQREYAALEIRLTLLGDHRLNPGDFLVFSDNNLTGFGAGYRILSVIDRVDPSSGYVTEVSLHRHMQYLPLPLLTDVIKDQVRYTAGTPSLLDQRATFPVVGTVQ